MLIVITTAAKKVRTPPYVWLLRNASFMRSILVDTDRENTTLNGQELTDHEFRLIFLFLLHMLTYFQAIVIIVGKCAQLLPSLH